MSPEVAAARFPRYPSRSVPEGIQLFFRIPVAETLSHERHNARAILRVGHHRLQYELLYILRLSKKVICDATHGTSSLRRRRMLDVALHAFRQWDAPTFGRNFAAADEREYNEQSKTAYVKNLFLWILMDGALAPSHRIRKSTNCGHTPPAPVPAPTGRCTCRIQKAARLAISV